jgi:hypothetical protein
VPSSSTAKAVLCEEKSRSAPVHIRVWNFYEAIEKRIVSSLWPLWVAMKELPSQRTNIRLSLEESSMSSIFQEATDVSYTIIINNKNNQQAVARKIVWIAVTT